MVEELEVVVFKLMPLCEARVEFSDGVIFNVVKSGLIQGDWLSGIYAYDADGNAAAALTCSDGPWFNYLSFWKGSMTQQDLGRYWEKASEQYALEKRDTLHYAWKNVFGDGGKFSRQRLEWGTYKEFEPRPSWMPARVD